MKSLYLNLYLLFFISCSSPDIMIVNPNSMSKNVNIKKNNNNLVINHSYDQEEIPNFIIEEEAINNEIELSYIDFKDDNNYDFFSLGKKLKPESMFSLPIKKYKRISDAFGYRIHPIYKKRRFHNGIDFVAKRGTEIFSVYFGTVIMSKRSKTYGNVIAIAHDNGYVSVYAHNDKNLVKKGDRVLKDQLIAKVGSTGLSTGSHLHFELKKMSKSIDPIKFYMKQKDMFHKIIR